VCCMPEKDTWGVMMLPGATQDDRFSASDETVRLWERRPAKRSDVYGHKGFVYCGGWSPNGSHVASVPSIRPFASGIPKRGPDILYGRHTACGIRCFLDDGAS